MVQRIQFPTATGWLIGYLAAVAAPVPVSSGITAGANRFIKVLRTGGPRSELVDSPQMTIEVYDEWEDAAEQYADTVRGWIHALAGTVRDGVNCKNVRDSGGLGKLHDDRTPGLTRFTFMVSLDLRGTAVEMEQG